MKTTQVTFQWITDNKVVRITEPIDHENIFKFYESLYARQEELKKLHKKSVNYYY